MIHILSDWHEIGEVTHFLRSKGLPGHAAAYPEKNWDIAYISEIADPLDRKTAIVDLGCKGSYALRLLSAMGFGNLYGLDLNISKRDRLSQLFLMLEKRSLKLPFHLYKQDITKTSFPDGRFDFAVCLSVIEHGVNIDSFFTETYRILKSKGLLLITTDYWEQKIPNRQHSELFGLPHKIFCRQEIEDIVKLAGKVGFNLCEDMPIPPCSEKPVEWDDAKYTFISLLFCKD